MIVFMPSVADRIKWMRSAPWNFESWLKHLTRYSVKRAEIITILPCGKSINNKQYSIYLKNAEKLKLHFKRFYTENTKYIVKWEVKGWKLIILSFSHTLNHLVYQTLGIWCMKRQNSNAEFDKTPIREFPNEDRRQMYNT